MTDSQLRGCPEPEVLAAYVDHGLSLAERAQVEMHLASCPPCTVLLAEVVRTVEDVAALTPEAGATAEATPLKARRAVMGGLAAAAAVIAVLVVPSLARPWLERDAGLVSLVDRVGEHRSVLGRLTGGFPHAPLDVPSAGGQDGQAAEADRVLLTVGRIRESFGEMQTASALHALGLEQLVAGRLDDAAQSLLAASREQPANARYLSDVAAVQLERARLGVRPDDLPRALAAADRARRLDPALREAWFNRALAVSALSLTEPAKAAWTEYLKRDAASPWAVEARTRLEELSKPTPLAAWTVIEGRLQRTIDAATADQAIHTHTSEARNFIENRLFADWAGAVLRDDVAGEELERLRAMADAMLRVSGDALYRDAVAAIERTNGNVESRRALALAHAQYVEVSKLYADDQYTQALPRLREAKAGFEAARTPYAIRPAIDLASIVNITGRYAEGAQLLDAAFATAASAQYGFAAGRVAWLQGLAAFQQGRLPEAQSKYEDTLAAFDRLGDVQQQAAAHLLLAGLFHYLGDAPQAWAHFGPALRGLNVTRSLRFRHGLLSAAATALRAGDPDAALAMQDETIRNAEQWGRDAALAEAYALRAEIHSGLGQQDAAQSDLVHARQMVSLSTDEAFKARLEVPVLATESELLRRTDPAAAAAAATRAIELVQGRRDRFRLAQLQLRLANANLAWGRPREAELALERGIKAFDDERRQLSDEARLSDRDEAWGLFEAAVEIAIGKKDVERAFAMAERARTRTLSETRKFAAVGTLADVQRSLAADEAIVALNQFNDQLVIWAIRHDSTSVTTRRLSRTDAQRLVARQQDEIRLEAARLTASQQLFDEILRPVSGRIASATRLVFVPDAVFEPVSFAALWDRSTRRFVIEKATVRVAVSVGAYAASAGRQPAVRPTDALLFGDRASGSGLREVAALYPSATVYEGDSATRAQFFANADRYHVMHLATRVQPSATNPMLSRILVADDPGRRHSGAILVSDIASRTLNNTRLVVVDGRDPNESYRGEGSSSVARAFMTAGVPAVVSTLPGAPEAATRDLLIAFHREMGRNIPAEQALANIQRNVLQQNGGRLGAWTALVLYGSDR